MKYAVKFLDFCNLHIKFYILSKCQYDMMFYDDLNFFLLDVHVSLSQFFCICWCFIYLVFHCLVSIYLIFMQTNEKKVYPTATINDEMFHLQLMS